MKDENFTLFTINTTTATTVTLRPQPWSLICTGEVGVGNKGGWGESCPQSY